MTFETHTITPCPINKIDLADRIREILSLSQNDSICITDAGETLAEITKAEFAYLRGLLSDAPRSLKAPSDD